MGFRRLAVAAGVAVAVIVAAAIIYMLHATPQHAMGGRPTTSPRHEYIYVVDWLNRTVKVPANVSRVVAIGPGMLRLVCYLGAVDKVVGVEESEIRWGFTGRDYAMAYGEVFKRLPVVGPGGPRSPPKPELIISVHPDVVIMHVLYAKLYDPDRLSREVGAPVIVLDYGKPGLLQVDAFIKAIRILGKVLGKEARAKQLESYVKALVEDLRRRTANITERPTVFVGGVAYKGRRGFTSSMRMFPPLTLLNTKSIVDDLNTPGTHVDVSFEYLLKKQPDVIFIDELNLETILADFRKEPWKYCALKAFRDGRVYGIIPFNFYHTNVAVALADAYYIGKILYPDRFKDVDPAAKADEIFTEFLGKPLYKEYAKAFGGFKSLASYFNCTGR